ncbi:MAG: DUF3108 domain-containing protein [candidate division KSB1 bacterium]|nr:DUF3108 domain-containing protein [candidate division KSB1 bacterium]MDZ7341692.1 DUF3108 domain-containing protein [candidate division KSB1 bacterium]
MIWLLLVAPGLWSQRQALTCISWEQLLGERLRYKMEYLNLSVATLDFHLAPKNEGSNSSSFRLSINAKSSGAVSWLFAVNNRYEIDIEPLSLLPARVQKTIRQKNVAYERTITFDHQRRQAACGDSLTWPIPDKCYDYFSMLYFLRTQPLLPGDTLQFYLDAEYRLSRVIAVVQNEPHTIRVPAGRFPALMVKIQFLPESNISRPWKTDLLTNRLTAPGSELAIYFSNDSYRFPLKIQYQQTSVQTQIILDSFHKGH